MKCEQRSGPYGILAEALDLAGKPHDLLYDLGDGNHLMPIPAMPPDFAEELMFILARGDKRQVIRFPRSESAQDIANRILEAKEQI